MASRLRLYTAAFILYLESSWYCTVGLENCDHVIGEEQPHCVFIRLLTETGLPSGVIFSLYRKVMASLFPAQFNFNTRIFEKFYDCLVQTEHINCTVSFTPLHFPSYNYTAKEIKAENIPDNDVQEFTDYWTCSVPLHPQNEIDINITCRRRVAEPLTPQCDLARICSSVGMTQALSENKNLVKIIWTLRFPGVPTDDCESRPLEIQYISSIVTVIPCSADSETCNGSTGAEGCVERPAGPDQSEDSSPTALIIGVVCGIVIIIVLVLLGAFFLRQKIRNNESSAATGVNGASQNLASLPSAQDIGRNDTRVSSFLRDATYINTLSNIPGINHELVLACDSLEATNTSRDSDTINGYATIADTEESITNPSGSTDKRVENHTDASAETPQYSSVDDDENAAGHAYLNEV